MTEPFVKTEYGVSYSSLGNRRARRGSVSQNITHTAVGFMSSDGAPLLPPRPSQPLSSLFLLSVSYPPPPPPITPLHLVTTQWCCSFPVCAASKTTTLPFPNHHRLHRPSPPASPSSPCLTPPSLPSLRDQTRTCTPSFIGGGGGGGGGRTPHAHKYGVTLRLKYQ